MNSSFTDGKEDISPSREGEKKIRKKLRIVFVVLVSGIIFCVMIIAIIISIQWDNELVTGAIALFFAVLEVCTLSGVKKKETKEKIPIIIN